MSRFCCLLIVAALLSVVASGRSIAAPPVSILTLEQVLTRLDFESPVIAEAKANLAKSKAEYTGSRALPNPRLFGSDERVERDLMTEKEQTIGVSQEISFLWERPQLIRARSRAYAAAQARYAEAIYRLRSDVELGFYRLRSLKAQREHADEILRQLTRLTDRTSARLDLGEASLYDYRRFTIAGSELRQEWLRLDEACFEERLKLMKLTGLTGEDIDNVRLNDAQPALVFETVETAIDYAREHSPRLAASQLERQAEARKLAASKWSLIPDVSVAVGRKEVTGGYSGPVVGIEVELPLLGQGRSQVLEASAANRAAEINLSAGEREIIERVRSLFARWEGLRDRSSREPSFVEEDYLAQAIELYDQGEIAALDLVEAMKSSLASMAAGSESQLMQRSVALRLAEICGYSLVDEQ